MSIYFNIPARLMGSESSVYAGSSSNIQFDAANGAKDALVSPFTWFLLFAEGPGFEISGSAQQRDLAAFEFEADILQRD